MKIVFMGTPEFSVPSLRKLVSDGHSIVGVFTQPDKPQNRGMKLTPSPIKKFAKNHEIPVYQPNTLKDGAVLDLLNKLSPELIVVTAYGKILPPEILEFPSLGCINVHASLLPRWRGAAPINWAILNGDTETGVSIMYMNESLDSGDIINQRAVSISPEETSESLYKRLSILGADLLSESLNFIENATVKRTPQDESSACYAPMLSKSLSAIDFTRPAFEIHNQIRGLLPWPVSTIQFGGETFKIFSAEETGESSKQAAGTILGADSKGIKVVCGDGKILRILELQAPGKKRMCAVDYLRGHKLP